MRLEGTPESSQKKKPVTEAVAYFRSENKVRK